MIERLNVDVMRGFGVTRRRGTETGGLLMGRIDRLSSPPVVHIQSFTVIPCEYALGPSYILSDNDRQRFREAVAQGQPSLNRDLYAVGYFRSHTRDDFALDGQDVSLFQEFFRDPLDLVLLIKPFATRPAKAGFFLQENGALATAVSPLEFTLESPTLYRQPEPAEIPPPPKPAPAPVRTALVEKRAAAEPDRPLFATHMREPSPWGRRLSWFAFSLALLAFGGACGYEYALAQNAMKLDTAGSARPVVETFSVGLQALPAEGGLTVKWDRDSAAIQAARHGILTVTDGAKSRDVRLGTTELRNGTALYPNVGNEVRFRLELYFQDNRSYIEWVGYRRPAN